MDNRWKQPITQEITVLVKKLLIPLAIKTKANANEFERALKQEMFEDLEYVQSLKKEVDELESEKAKFLNEYDLLLQECVSKDIMCSILQQHCIDLELVLQKEKEKEKNLCQNSWVKQSLKSRDTEKAFKEQNDSLIAELNRKTLEINDLKAHLQDKTIANAEMRESWNKMKGKGVDTNFGKPSILGKPPLQIIRNQPVVRQPTVFKSERSSFSKTRFASQVVEKTTFKIPVTPHSCPQSPKESVGLNDMVHNYYIEEDKKMAQLQKDKAFNSKPSVITPARFLNTASGSKPKPRNYNQQTRNWPTSMNS
ncbi:hypothetical protein Tco_1102988 [Tanacetum coccineum]